ncbi:hypothetical protein RI129_008853 [Pyrocoelia pectoralis]|uniref:O-acyltransferase WSD1 C-terminal domain-containing protein n=1 Tax=Pyrocoelia pectoralis TaxID=417401 RepID=A0AAN7VBW7_9COLE
MDAMIVITALMLIVLLIVFGINYYYIKEIAKMKKVPINVIPSLIVGVLVVPLLGIALPLFWLIRNIVGLLLRIQCGRNFMGFFDGLDALHGRLVTATINILLVMELDSHHSKQNLLKMITDLVDKTIISKRREMPKFCSTLRSYLGYKYMLYQPNLDVHRCVKVLNIIQGERKSKLSKDELMMLINHHSSDQFPYENKLMWDVYIGTQPINWRDNLEKTYYPVLFRFNHGVADAVNLFKFITGVCANVDDIIQHRGVCINSKRAFTFVATAMNTLITVLFSPAVFCAMFVIKKDKTHSYQKMERNGLTNLHAEISSEYLCKIKKIISKYKRASFTGVLMTAISAFFEDYYTKNNQACPEYLTAVLPIHPHAMELITLKPGSLIHNDVRIRNEHHALHLILPISPKKDFRLKDRSLTDRLNVIMDHIYFEKRNIVRKVVVDLLALLSAYMPSPILTLFPPLPNTICVSNVPGSSTISLGEDNLKVCDYTFLVPDMQTVCYFLAITSYEQRLQISLSIRSWLWCKDNFQVIIDNIYKYIDLLEKEIENSEEK